MSERERSSLYKNRTDELYKKQLLEDRSKRCVSSSLHSIWVVEDGSENDDMASQPSSQEEHFGQEPVNLQPAEEVELNHPWWMWIIGYMDITSAAILAVILVHHLLVTPFKNAETFIWWYSLMFLGIGARFVQGFCLHVGLKSSDNSNALWCFKIWTECQVFFVIEGVVKIFYLTFCGGTWKSLDDENGIFFAEICVICTYRVVCFVLVKTYASRLKPPANFMDEGQQATIYP